MTPCSSVRNRYLFLTVALARLSPLVLSSSQGCKRPSQMACCHREGSYARWLSRSQQMVSPCHQWRSICRDTSSAWLLGSIDACEQEAVRMCSLLERLGPSLGRLKTFGRTLLGLSRRMQTTRQTVGW